MRASTAKHESCMLAAHVMMPLKNLESTDVLELHSSCANPGEARISKAIVHWVAVALEGRYCITLLCITLHTYVWMRTHTHSIPGLLRGSRSPIMMIIDAMTGVIQCQGHPWLGRP